MLQNLRKNRRCTRNCAIFIYIFPFPLPTDSLLTPVDSVSEVLPADCEDDYSQVEQLPSQQSPTSMTAAAAAAAAANTSAAVAAAASTATDDELLELAAKGGIQFVRATEDGRYEVMTNSEARDLMAQNSHDVKILGTEETETIISMPADLEYIPMVQELQQQNQQQHQQHQLPEIILPDSDGIMVLDPNNDQKALTLGDIEILEDKELRQLLDARCLENRSYTPDAPEVTYLSQAKIDEILNAKPISIDTAMSILDESELAGMRIKISFNFQPSNKCMMIIFYLFSIIMYYL